MKVAESYNGTSFQDLQGIAFNLGLVQGGIKPNIIADHAQVKFGMDLPGQSFDDLLKEFSTDQSKTIQNLRLDLLQHYLHQAISKN